MGVRGRHGQSCRSAARLPVAMAQRREALDSRATHSVLPRKGSPLTGLQLAFSVNRALTAAGPSRRGAEHSELVFNGSVVRASSYETSEAVREAAAPCAARVCVATCLP